MEPTHRVVPTLAKCFALSLFSWAVVMGAARLRDYVARALTTPAQAAPQPGQPGYDALFAPAPQTPTKGDPVGAAIRELRQRGDAAYAALKTGGVVEFPDGSGLGPISDTGAWSVMLAAQRFPCPLYQALDLAGRCEVDAAARAVASDLRPYPDAAAAHLR